MIGAVLVQYHRQAHFDPHTAWDGFTLPGFDAHVYVAMAEEPRVFTVGPWGYRILLPGLIGTFLPPRLIVPGFEWTARASLVAASGLLFVYLRVLGGTIRAALLAVGAVMLTPSVDRVFANPFLVEPVALALLLVALISIEISANTWMVALALIVLSLTKEIWLFLVPLILIRNLADGVRSATLSTVRVAGPALWLAAWMRWRWSPQTGVSTSGTDYGAALGSVASNITSFAPEFLLGGLAVLGLIALRKEEARDYLKEHFLTLLGFLALPLLAATYTGEGAATSFFADDVRRLLIYALPFAAALAVRLDPVAEHPLPLTLFSNPRFERGAMSLVLASTLSPLMLDPYSRADLSTSRDGPYVLGFTRETLKTARKLERGETVVLDPEERKFAWGVSPPNELSKLRFFLRDGFGPLAHYGVHDIRMRETNATIIVPLFAPRALTLALTMDAETSAWVTVMAGSNRLGEILVGPQAVRAAFEIPAANLFRGDNPIELRCDKAASAVPRVVRIELSQTPARP